MSCPQPGPVWFGTPNKCATNPSLHEEIGDCTTRCRSPRCLSQGPSQHSVETSAKLVKPQTTCERRRGISFKSPMCPSKCRQWECCWGATARCAPQHSSCIHESLRCFATNCQPEWLSQIPQFTLGLPNFKRLNSAMESNQVRLLPPWLPCCQPFAFGFGACGDLRHNEACSVFPGCQIYMTRS